MIQRGLLLGLSVGCLGALLPLSAYAQDGGSTIRVIKRDGTIQSIEIPKKQSEPAKPTEPEPKNTLSAEDLMKQMEAAIDEGEGVSSSDATTETDPNLPDVILKERSLEPIPADAVPIREPENTAPTEVKEESPKKQKKKVVKKKKTKPKAVAKTNVHQYTPSSAPPPLPGVKPPKPTYVMHSSTITDYTDLPSSVRIDKDIALRVALEYAPPARSFTVYENRQYKDRIVYQVTFRTEGGPHDILVDAETGDVLKK